MEVSSSHQVYIFFLYILSGLLCGAFFDVQRYLRGKYRAGRARTLVEDMLFVLFCIITVIGFGYFFNNGEMRYYQLMGTLSGVLFYASLLSRAFGKLLDAIFFLIVTLIFKPVKKFCCIIMVPIRAGLKVLVKLKNKKNRLMKSLLRHLKKRKKRLKKRIKML